MGWFHHHLHHLHNPNQCRLVHQPTRKRPSLFFSNQIPPAEIPQFYTQFKSTPQVQMSPMVASPTTLYTFMLTSKTSKPGRPSSCVNKLEAGEDLIGSQTYLNLLPRLPHPCRAQDHHHLNHQNPWKYPGRRVLGQGPVVVVLNFPCSHLFPGRRTKRVQIELASYYKNQSQKKMKFN